MRCPLCGARVKNQTDFVHHSAHDCPEGPQLSEVEVASRRCPYCAEMIPAKASKCSHCGEWLRRAVARGPQRIQYGRALGIVVAFLVVVWLVSRNSDHQPPATSNDQQSQTLALPPDFPFTTGMTWDECVPILNKTRTKRLTAPVWETADRWAATYKIGDGAYTLTFQRPASPELGPYELVRIGRSALPPGPSNAEISQGLTVGMTLDEALPLMRRVGGIAGGFFTLQTKDRFVAVLQADDDSTIRVTFERPKNVPRPDVIADATPEALRMTDHVPLDAMPEFGGYQVTAVKTSR